MQKRKKIKSFIEKLDKFKDLLKDDDLSVSLLNKLIKHYISLVSLTNKDSLILMKLVLSTIYSIICYFIAMVCFYDYFSWRLGLFVSITIFILVFVSIKQVYPITTAEREYLNLTLKEKTCYKNEYDVICKEDRLFYINDLNELKLIDQGNIADYKLNKIYTDGYICYEKYKEIDFDNLEVKSVKNMVV